VSTTPRFVNAFGRRLWRRITGKSFVSTAQDAKSFQDVLLTRRTINEFEVTLPDNWDSTLQRAIQAATYAPNHKRTEPWRFHLLGPESIRKVCELNAKLITADKGPEAGEKKLKRWLHIPGWIVVTCQRAAGGDEDGRSMLNPTSLAREDYAACCCAIQNLCLSLHANGIGTKWTTGSVNFDPGFAEAVGFSTNEEYVVGTIWFGTPASESSVPVKKLTMEDVLIRHS
jgi:nitroreductase